MNHIYIITKSGKVFNNEGVQHVFKELFGEEADSRSVVEMGYKNNSPSLLASNLKKHKKGSYIVFSDNIDLTYISGENNINDVVKTLESNESANSWDLIKKFVEDNNYGSK